MSALHHRRDELEKYEFMMGPARGRLAVSLDMLTDALILIPAFVVSELQTGYEIGFLIYIPFVVIDLLISNLLMALGMQQVSPQTITVPLKLLLFLMVDGWHLLIGALMRSFS